MPAVRIADAPRFGWRGMMLDVARHFMPKDFVLKVIDVIALHRLNVLHLHLTDDQGWRVQIDAYPKLTEVGAWRAESMVGKMSHGQTEFELRRHAARRVLHQGRPARDRRVRRRARHHRRPGDRPAGSHAGRDRGVPGARQQPGHRSSAVRQYWGISEDVLNVNDATVDFVKTVLREVLEIFPSPYIHLGGDECPSVQWRDSEAAQKRQADLGLTDAGQLQGWFTAQVASVLAEEGRRLVGWDEMVETDCPKDAVIMAWRSAQRGEIAVKAGHEVVMAPCESVYFDYYQGDPATEPLAIGNFIPLQKVYDFEVIPPGRSPRRRRRRIVGTQCQIWTEYMEGPEQVGYMLLPRLSAFAERAWGSPRTSYDEFLTRLRPHLAAALGLNDRR